MTERFRNVSPIFFSNDGRWLPAGAEFPRGTMEVEALVTGVLFRRGEHWEILWEWNGIPHIYDAGVWQQYSPIEEWTFRLYGDDEPLTPGRYRVTVWRNYEAVAQGEFVIRGRAPPAGGALALGELSLYQHHGRHLAPCGRGGSATALGVTLCYANVPSGALVHIIWRHEGRLLWVENRTWRGSATGEELLCYTAEHPQGLEPGLYELWVACWPDAPLYRCLQY